MHNVKCFHFPIQKVLNFVILNQLPIINFPNRSFIKQKLLYLNILDYIGAQSAWNEYIFNFTNISISAYSTI